MRKANTRDAKILLQILCEIQKQKYKYCGKYKYKTENKQTQNISCRHCGKLLENKQKYKYKYREKYKYKIL